MCCELAVSEHVKGDMFTFSTPTSLVEMGIVVLLYSHAKIWVSN